MSPNETMNAIDRLQSDSKRVADALHSHARELPVASPDHAALNRLFRSVADFHSTLTLAQKPQHHD
jgi:hypothetical protein